MLKLICCACAVFMWWVLLGWICSMETKESTMTTDGLIISSAIIFAAVWIGG